MVYVDPGELKWMPYVNTWMAKFKDKLQPETLQYITDLFQNYVEDGLQFCIKKCTQAINQVLKTEFLLHDKMWKLFSSLLNKPFREKHYETSNMRSLLALVNANPCQDYVISLVLWDIYQLFLFKIWFYNDNLLKTEIQTIVCKLYTFDNKLT